jgi:hypothetical protein
MDNLPILVPETQAILFDYMIWFVEKECSESYRLPAIIVHTSIRWSSSISSTMWLVKNDVSVVAVCDQLNCWILPHELWIRWLAGDVRTQETSSAAPQHERLIPACIWDEQCMLLVNTNRKDKHGIQLSFLEPECWKWRSIETYCLCEYLAYVYHAVLVRQTSWIKYMIYDMFLAIMRLLK